MVKVVKKGRTAALLAVFAAAFVLSVVGAFGFKPTSARAQEKFELTENWDFTTTSDGGKIEAISGGVRILAGQARYKEALPIGANDVESITVRFEYLGQYTKNWLSVGFAPSTTPLGAGAVFWPQSTQTVGIFPVLNAENNTMHRVFMYPQGGYMCDFKDDVGNAVMGLHTLSLIKNSDNTLSVCLDGKLSSAKSERAVSEYTDDDGNIYLHIDDSNSVGVNVLGVQVNSVGTYAGGGIVDSAMWTNKGGDNASNGQEIFLSGGQSVFSKGIDVGASTFKSVKLKFRLVNANDWASVGFARTDALMGAGAHFWGSGSPGVYFIVGQKGESTQSHIHCKGNSPTSLGSFEITDNKIAGDHTVELKKNADGTLSAYLDGVKAPTNSFAISEITGEESSLLYLHADDANGDQIVIKQLIINDERGPAITVAGGIPEEALTGRTNEKIDLPSATASDAVDGNVAVDVKVFAPGDKTGTTVENFEFTPEAVGEHSVVYSAEDMSGNKTVIDSIKINVESSVDMPVLTVGEWEPKNFTVGDKVVLPTATATLADVPVAVVVTLRLPDGKEQTLDSNEYVTVATGVHTVVYTAQGNNDNVAQKEISFTVLPQITSDDATKAEVYSDPVYWNSNVVDTTLASAENNGGIIVSAVDRGKLSTANYLVPISMLDRVKIFFTAESSGDWISFSLTKEPVAVTDFDAVSASKAHKTDGVYFMMSGSAYNITCTTNRQFRYLGDSQTVAAYPFAGKHTLEFIRGKAGFMLKLDGVTCPSGEPSNVPHETFINGNDETYLAIGSKNVTAVRIDRITTQADDDAPVIDYAEDVNKHVGDVFTIPQLTATDGIDGEVPVSYVVYDAYGRVYDLQDAQTDIELIFEGEWRIEYTAFDSSGNKALFTLTIFVEANPDLPGFWLSGTPDPNGRTGVEYVLPQYNVDNGGTVTITLKEPSGKETDITAEGKFTPEVIGLYTVTYTVSNGDGKSYEAIYFVNVKINADINTTMNPDVFNDVSHWVQNTENTLEKTDDGLLLKGTKAYYEYPLDMSIGVVMNIRLDVLGNMLEHNNWLGVTFMPKAAFGDYANYGETGIYMMFYNNGGTLMYNVGTLNAAGNFVFAANGVLGTYEDNMNLSIKLMKYAGGNAQYFDNVVLYLNGIEIVAETMNNVHYSEVVDDENFTFVCLSKFGGVSEDIMKVTVRSVKIADVIKPTITLPEYPADVKIGDSINLSGISYSDNEDTELNTEIRIQTPDGFILLGSMLEGGVLTFDKEGKYVITITARDSSGNFDFAVVNVNVTQAKKRGCKCVASASAGSIAALIAVVAIVVSVVILRKRLSCKR